MAESESARWAAIRRLPRRLRKRVRWHYSRWLWSRVARQNERDGYARSPVQRYRCCAHTTPFHYRWCDERPTTEAAQ